MNELREQTQAIALALAARLTAEQLNEIREDLIQNWCDGELIDESAPSGADVMLFAFSDACAIAGRG